MTASIGGIAFDGFERGWEMTIDRHIEVVDVIGSRPRLIPLFPTAATDEAVVTCEFWAKSSAAAQIEAGLPPRGSAASSTLLLGSTSTSPRIPGFGTFASDNWRIFGCVLEEPISSRGRKAPSTDLFGYSMRFRFGANAYGLAGSGGNERTGAAPTSTAIPQILSRKFAAHQIQDPSKLRGPVPVGSGVAFPTTVHGVRRDATTLLDHLTESEATAVCDWFRAIRAAAFNITCAELFGPGMASTVSAVATGLVIRRATGNWWEVDLSLSYAGPST